MSSELSLFYAVEMSGICQESVICFLPVLSDGVPKSFRVWFRKNAKSVRMPVLNGRGKQ